MHAIRHNLGLVLCLPFLGALLAGCSTFESESPVRLNMSAEEMTDRWNATITSPREVSGVVDITGTAWMQPESGRTQVAIQISNAAPGGVHPWEVRRGRCGASARTLGGEGDYEPLEVGDEGTAAASTTLDLTPSEEGNYFVAVYASPTNRDLTIACGNLAPPTG